MRPERFGRRASRSDTELRIFYSMAASLWTDGPSDPSGLGPCADSHVSDERLLRELRKAAPHALKEQGWSAKFVSQLCKDARSAEA